MIDYDQSKSELISDEDIESSSKAIKESGRSIITRDGRSVSGDGGPPPVTCKGDEQREVVIASVIISTKGEVGERESGEEAERNVFDEEVEDEARDPEENVE